MQAGDSGVFTATKDISARCVSNTTFLPCSAAVAFGILCAVVKQFPNTLIVSELLLMKMMHCNTYSRIWLNDVPWLTKDMTRYVYAAIAMTMPVSAIKFCGTRSPPPPLTHTHTHTHTQRRMRMRITESHYSFPAADDTLMISCNLAFCHPVLLFWSIYVVYSRCTMFFTQVMELTRVLESAGHEVREIITSGTPGFKHALAYRCVGRCPYITP